MWEDLSKCSIGSPSRPFDMLSLSQISKKQAFLQIAPSSAREVITKLSLLVSGILIFLFGILPLHLIEHKSILGELMELAMRTFYYTQRMK